MDVRGVAGQEDAARAVGVDLSLVAVEPRQPPRVVHAVVVAQHATRDVSDLVQGHGCRIGSLVVAVPRDDAEIAVTERCDEGEAVFVGVHGEHVARRRLQAHVGQHHGLHGGAAREWQAQGAAHAAVDPIRSDHIAGTTFHVGTSTRGADEDAVVGLTDGLDVDALLEPYARVTSS